MGWTWQGADCHALAVHYSTFALVSDLAIAALTVFAGVVRYRRGDRWLLLAVLAIPAGARLGMYAGDHRERVLGVLAFVLIEVFPVSILVARRRAAAAAR